MAEQLGPRRVQTVGPFLHIALADPAGSLGRAGRYAGGDHGRAVSCSTATAHRSPTPSSRPGRSTATSRRCATDDTGSVAHPHGQATACRHPRRHAAGATPRRVGLRPWPARPRRRRGSTSRDEHAANATDPMLAAVDAGPSPPAARRAPTGRRRTVSTSGCKVTMSPSSSPSDERSRSSSRRGPVAEATSAAAWLQALLDAEAALAGAQADAGDIPRGRRQRSPAPAWWSSSTWRPSSTRQPTAATR